MNGRQMQKSVSHIQVHKSTLFDAHTTNQEPKIDSAWPIPRIDSNLINFNYFIIHCMIENVTKRGIYFHHR